MNAEEKRRPPIPNKLSEWRVYRGFSQIELAERIGYSKQHYGKWEGLKRPIPSQALPLLTKVLSCTVDDIYNNEPGSAPLQENDLTIQLLKQILHELRSLNAKLAPSSLPKSAQPAKTKTG